MTAPAKDIIASALAVRRGHLNVGTVDRMHAQAVLDALWAAGYGVRACEHMWTQQTSPDAWECLDCGAA